MLDGTIENYSSNAYRRVELKCQLASDVDHVHASELLRQNLAKIPNVLSDPAPLVEIFEFTDIGPKWAVFRYGLAKQVWIDQQGTPKV
ncbi:mechanosensitive ion channel family protein [Acidithiobacillus thiooxidans]|uniref:mechanosensitive ion channel family protein n=1 Tax=Acidithiobacillus thiooxidans TaxID=930 RepID=UPI0002624E65|nr:mechanosensitive ion channel family protein [Acidithiobacillus thiooxidans]